MADAFAGTDGRAAPIEPATRGVGSALGWSFAMNSVRLLSTVGTAFLLASVLGPTAFGTVALALLFIGLIELLIQQGVMTAIVQRRNLSYRELDSAFWATIVVSFGLVAVCVVVAPWWAAVNGSPEATRVMWALSSLVMVKGIVVVHEGLLRRQLRFRELAVRTTIASVAGASLGIAWVLLHPSVWAIVGQQLLSAAVGAVVIWRVAPWRPRWFFQGDDVRELFGFASKATASGIGVFVNTRVDAVLIGVYFGAAAIGLYHLASRLVRSAIEATVQPIAGVSLADFARRQHDRELLKQRYLTLVGLASSVGAPVMGVLFACATPLMEMVGADWQPAAAVLQLLCIVGVVTAVGIVNGPALQAAGRPGAQAALVWVGAGVSALTFAIVGLALSDEPLEQQVVGMAGSRAVVFALVLLPISQALIKRVVGVTPWQFVGAAAPSVGSSLVAAAVGLQVDAALASASIPSPLRVALTALVTLGVALPLLLLSSSSARLAFAQVRSRTPGARRGTLAIDGEGEEAVVKSA